MYLQSRHLIIIGAVAVCGVIATAAILHNRANSPVAGQPVSYSEPATASYAPPVTAYSQPEPPPYSQSPAYAQAPAQAYDDGYYSSVNRPVYVRPQEYIEPAQPVVVAQPRPVYQERYYSERPRRHHGRSKEHSVAIVAGSAGVGAAIGAIAGGGKGAALGALAGGGAGFIYDRATHNH
jgi:hypothetical protein